MEEKEHEIETRFTIGARTDKNPDVSCWSKPSQLESLCHTLAPSAVPDFRRRKLSSGDARVLDPDVSNEFTTSKD